MTVVLALSFFSLPIFGYLLWRMRQAGPTSRMGRWSFRLFAFLYVQLLLILLPIPFLHVALPAYLQQALALAQSTAATFLFVDGLVFVGAVLLLGLAWAAGERPRVLRSGLLYALLAFLFNPFLLVWAIAGAEGLFRGAVPLEQRLVSHNEEIRKTAQQELLGLSTAAKRALVHPLTLGLHDENASVRKWTAISLALMGPTAREALPELLESSADVEKEVAEASRVALSELAPPEASQMGRLLPFLVDTREAVRCQTAALVAGMGEDARDAVPALLGEIRRRRPVSACMAEAAARLAPALPDLKAELLAALATGSYPVRRNAVAALGEIGSLDAEVAAALLERLAKDGDSGVRRASARALTLPGVPSPGLLEALSYAVRRAENASVRAIALEQLRAREAPLRAVQAAMEAALRDPSPPVRQAAADWMVSFGARGWPALSALIEALKDPEPGVRRSAMQAVRRISPRRKQWIPALVQAQSDSEPLVRCLAAQQLAQMGAAGQVAVDSLIEDLATHTGPDFCAGDALGMAGHFNRQVVPALVKVLQGRQTEPAARAAQVLMQLGPKAKAAIPALQQAKKAQVPGADNALRAIQPPATPRSRRRR